MKLRRRLPGYTPELAIYANRHYTKLDATYFIIILCKKLVVKSRFSHRTVELNVFRALLLYVQDLALHFGVSYEGIKNSFLLNPLTPASVPTEDKTQNSFALQMRALLLLKFLVSKLSFSSGVLCEAQG